MKARLRSRPGEAGPPRDLVEGHLRKFPEAAFTPHQVGKVLTWSVGAVAKALVYPLRRCMQVSVTRCSTVELFA